MSSDQVKKGNTLMIVVYVLLLGALATITLPTISFKVPPLGSKSLSVSEVVKVIPKAVSSPAKKKKSGGIKLDYDFVDVLLKTLPKNEKNEPKMLSIPFILGVLVPIALALTYVLVLLSFLVAPFHKGLLGTVSFWSVLSSIYVLAGTFYLGFQAKQAVARAVEKASEGTFGALTKKLVPDISIQPESGLYALAAICFVIFVVNMFRPKKKG